MKSDTDKLFEISSFSGSIENIYKILENLEKKGKKDTEEYKEYLGLLESARAIELKKYREIANVFSDEVIDYKTSILNINNAHLEELGIDRILTEDDILNILNMSQGSNRTKRMFAQLRDISLLRCEEPPMDEEDLDLLEGKDIIVQLMNLKFKIPSSQASKLGIDIPMKREQINNQREKESELRKISCDIKYYKYGIINAIFLEYLNNYIDNCKNKTIKNRLISYKYKLIYSTPTLEQYFIHEKSGKNYFHEMVLFMKAYNPDELHYIYTTEIVEEVNNALAEISGANYSSKTATIDEKIKNILKILYAKSLVSSVIEEENVEYLQMANSASKLTCESKDDLDNINEVFNTDENIRIPVLSRKKVD